MASNVKIKRKKNKDLPLILIGAGALLVVGVLIWQAVSFSSSKIPSQPADVARVSLAEAKGALDAGSAVFLDVRSAGASADSHVAGAINIPEAELPDRLGELDKQDWIITYCTWPAEDSSARAALFMLQNGFKKVNPVLGGFAAWLEAGYPIEP